MKNYFVVFGSKETNFTQEKPLEEKQLITYFWKKCKNKNIVKKRKNLTISLIEELFLVNIEKVKNIKDFVVFNEKTSQILKFSEDDNNVIFFASKKEAKKDCMENEKVYRYCDLMKNIISKNSTQYKIKRYEEAKIDLKDKEFVKSSGLKEKMAIATFINQKQFIHITYDDNYLSEFTEETLQELNKYFSKRFNNYQLMKIFDVSEKTISNWKKLLKIHGIK